TRSFSGRATGPEPTGPDRDPYRGFLGELRGAPVVALRIFGPPEALRQARELEARRATLLEGEAGVEKALRLAPELGLRAEPAERREEACVAAALGEPALSRLEARARLGDPLGRLQSRGQLAVKRHELGRPLLPQRALEDVSRKRRPPERGRLARRRRRDARMHLVLRRDALPSPLE